jgi:Uma2 family endonuclease
MSTILHLSVAEFDRMVECGAFEHLNRKIELIRGELREMHPAGPLHDDLIRYLTGWSVRAADPSSTVVSVHAGLDLSALVSRPEPDLLWLRAARYRDRHPSAADVQLAIEVADSSLPTDLFEKSRLYAEAEILEYWIVDARGECLHVFRSPTPSGYAERFVAKLGEQLSPLTPCLTPLDLQTLFRSE